MGLRLAEHGHKRKDHRKSQQGDFFDQQSDWCMQDYLPERKVIQAPQEVDSRFFSNIFKQHYNIEHDHLKLLALAQLSEQERAQQFDLLRKNYPRRYEYNQYIIQGLSDNKKAADALRQLLFNVAD